MGANDNILAGLTGLTEGVGNILVPYVQAKQKAGLEDELAARQYQRQMIPVSRAEAISGEKTGLPQDQFVSPQELGLFQNRMPKREGFTNIVDKRSGRLLNRVEGSVSAVGAPEANWMLKSQGIQMLKSGQTPPEGVKWLDDTGKSGGKLPQQQLTAINNAKTTIDLLRNVVDKSSSGKFDTGPTSLRYHSGTFGNPYMNVMGSPEEASFKSDLTDTNAAYASARTGAQRGFKEIQWLAPAMPNGEMKPAALQAVGKQAMQRMAINLNNLITSAKSTGYDVSEFENYLADLKDELGGNFGGSNQSPHSAQSPGFASKSPKPGGVMHQDAGGNKAWVYPDGTFDEVK